MFDLNFLNNRIPSRHPTCFTVQKSVSMVTPSLARPPTKVKEICLPFPSQLWGILYQSFPYPIWVAVATAEEPHLSRNFKFDILESYTTRTMYNSFFVTLKYVWIT